jgi:heparosan-N-sulfate-glucuronate 5-epimerase
MSSLRRLALGFPLTWSHRRAYDLSALARPGEAPYFIEWDPGNGAYGESWEDAARDGDGVLYGGPSRCYHPIHISQYALHLYRLWHAGGDPSVRADFLAQATWLRDHQQSGAVDGSYRFDFPWSKYGAGAGWSSAMAQGEAISVLLRAERVKPSAGYADAALRAANPFFYDVDGGGVAWRDADDLFFEEIANRHAPHVLNGCIYALWGLWELWKQTGDPAQERLVEACADTLRRWLPSYDTGWWTLYSRMRSASGRPHVATLKYHQFHIAQMRVLAKMFDEPSFDEAARRWTSYVERRECRARLFGATVSSLHERLLKRDTVLGGAHT